MGGNGTTSDMNQSSQVTENIEKSRKTLSRRFCVAPMMEWTDRHCRFFHRLLTRRALIYTEMLTTGAVLHGDRSRLLGFDSVEAALVRWRNRHASSRILATTKSISTWGARPIGCRKGVSAHA
jgi:tRNA-dihydrouridine synthase A